MIRQPRTASAAAPNRPVHGFSFGRWRVATERRVSLRAAGLAVLLMANVLASEHPAGIRFREEVQPILTEYCYDCHGDGMSKGKVAFDEFKSDAELVGRKDLWQAVLKNLRAGLMPPEKKPRPTADEQTRLERWVKHDAFGIDPGNPDPGRTTLRRLNRVEYRNTLRDLTGYDFKVEEELPPDDTGYGFDNIADVLTLSPMLLEKYMQAAETVVQAALPKVSRVVQEISIPGRAFRTGEGSEDGRRDRHSFYEPARLHHEVNAPHAGSYRVVLEFDVAGEFDFDPGRARLIFRVDDREMLREELSWQNNKRFQFDFDLSWVAGPHRLALDLEPLTPVDQKKNSLNLRIAAVHIQGPLEKEHWVRPKGFERFFWRDPPEDPAERRQYAREVLARFATKAYRRPVDDRTIERLLEFADSITTQPGRSFEDGIAQAIVPILASPRFLFRSDVAESSASAAANPENDGTSAGPKREIHYPEVDEYSLASRLSYFLWSTMPDEELFRLAESRELRRNLPGQIRRMLADERSAALIENFVGQWLQVRDVDGIDINARVVLSRDRGDFREGQRARQRLEELRALPKLTPEQEKERDQLIQSRSRNRGQPEVELDRELRRALRQETEMSFAHVLREDRSALELIDSDYTFLNERLARHYGVPDVTGQEMRRVVLPEGHPRGGVLTQGSVLIVTSNPTRTSPVKRGLFILDNILGTPPPPPPDVVPALEESEKEFTDREPTLREVLAVHREKPLCSSCHNRMDPLGLALENFNALGLWREKERNQPIETAGRLITGEAFQDIREMKRILATQHRLDFYRCLTEKFLTYALGRGLEYYDVHSVDRIVERLDRSEGRLSALMLGVVESAPFQRIRRAESAATTTNDGLRSDKAMAYSQGGQPTDAPAIRGVESVSVD